MSHPTFRLQLVPVSLFSSVMGLSGLSIAWRHAGEEYGLPSLVAAVVFWAAFALFGVLVVVYAAKWLRHPAAARDECADPITIAFVPTITVAALLLATASNGRLPSVAEGLWWFGAVGQLVLTVLIGGAWVVRGDLGRARITPAWFIPVVGNAVTPLAATQVGSLKLAWVAFGVAAASWFLVLPLVVHRIWFRPDPLPGYLLPSTAILVAPPAVGSMAWAALDGSADNPLSRALYALALLCVVLVLVEAPRLRRAPFTPAYWAYTFPGAAVSAAAITMAHLVGAGIGDIVAIGLLVATSVIALVVSTRTALAVRDRSLFAAWPTIGR